MCSCILQSIAGVQLTFLNFGEISELFSSAKGRQNRLIFAGSLAELCCNWRTSQVLTCQISIYVRRNFQTLLSKFATLYRNQLRQECSNLGSLIYVASNGKQPAVLSDRSWPCLGQEVHEFWTSQSLSRCGNLSATTMAISEESSSVCFRHVSKLALVLHVSSSRSKY